MSSDALDRIARTVLYEGYILYPYRRSALKNQQRWNFGVLYPPSWTVGQIGSDRSYFQMECLAFCSEIAQLDISLRFLQLVLPELEESAWQEAVEQKLDLDALCIPELVARPRAEDFSFAAGVDASTGSVRRQFPIDGRIEVSAAQQRERIYRLSVCARNVTDCQAASRDEALVHSMISAHAVLRIRDGEFISQIEPPEELRNLAAVCQNTGVWPVLVGESGVRDTMLGSPIILYDYPQVAPESKGDLFDATEIDEMLTLRILALTDVEKEELRRSDEHARRILERLEASPPEHLLDLHGTFRSVGQPATEDRRTRDLFERPLVRSAAVRGVELEKGDRVRLLPQRRADIFDTLLEGKIAVIEAVEEDFEGNIHFAVVLEDDPGRDLGEMRQVGHRFFFSREEIEPISRGSIQGRD
jgi:hypothetical protein